MANKKSNIILPKNYLKNLNFKINIPTFICSCGEKVLDTPENRVQSKLFKNDK